jgi:hypothetical protein
MAGSARADDAQVTVVAPGGAQQTLSLDALAGSEDVLERAYTVRSTAGEGAQTVTGFSLAAILEAAGTDPFGFSYLEVQRPAGGAVLLSRHQALDPDAFSDGSPVVYSTVAGTGFLRPSSGPEDINSTDSFEAPQGIALVLRNGTPLQVRAKASTPRTQPGKTIRFTAIVDRAGSGEQISYSWYFDDGHSASGASASHSFAKRGSYDVVVGVTTPGDEAGASAVVRVQVGAPIAGPDRKGGGRSHEANAPDHGAATGPTGAPPGPTGAPPGPTGDSQAAPSPPPQPENPERPQQPRQPPSASQVSGLLIDDPETAAAAPAPAARAGTLQGDGGGGLPAGAWGLLATVGLLGAGALLEARGLGALLGLGAREGHSPTAMRSGR